MKRIFAALLLLPSFALFAQSHSLRIPPAGVSVEGTSQDDWNPTLRVEEPDAGLESGNEAIKDSLAALYKNHPHASASHAQRSASGPAAPVMNRNFAANNFNNGTPNDNEIAIANNGHLISVQNSNIFRRNTTTATNLGTQSLALWSSSLSNSASKYDPKVMYDPEANRFIMVCLAGYSSVSTNIIVGFSKSDTANGQYNLYLLPGNPFGDTTWTDYPMIAVNHDELFITGNLVKDNQPWQTGFVQTLIWQVNKWDGYRGDTLRTELHGNINYNNRPVRNLCPVEGGAFVANGPGLYFLSDRNLAAGNDTIFLVHVTDTANSANQQVTVTPLVSNTSYFMPANAREPGNVGNMATNDARILGAFLQNDLIQFVGNTMDTSTGNCAIYHGMVHNVSTSPSVTATIVGDTALEYGYPNIAYVGQGAVTDNTAMIVFFHTDSTTYPGFSALVSDGNGNYSPRLAVKNGLDYIDVLSGDERWGDYSGIQRKYDVGGTCWVNGMYGQTSHTHGTWVGELGVSSDVSVQPVAQNAADISIYPNPFAESIHIDFEMQQSQRVRFVLYDMTGREVKLLLEDQVTAGEARFAFSTGPLQPGAYLLRAEAADGSVLFTNRIVKQ